MVAPVPACLPGRTTQTQPSEPTYGLCPPASSSSLSALRSSGWSSVSSSSFHLDFFLVLVKELLPFGSCFSSHSGPYFAAEMATTRTSTGSDLKLSVLGTRN